MITRYEILRGLKARGATGQQRAFESFCATNSVLPLTDAVVVRAADIYANLHQRGELIGDADILIAATAMVEERTLVTNNRRHFDCVEDLRVENWLEDNNGEETL
jgi:tRNA(fMet)-specific endonuclease VapC